MTQQFDINKRLMALLKNEIHAQKELNALAKQRSKLESSLGKCVVMLLAKKAIMSDFSLIREQHQNSKISDFCVNWTK